MGATASCRNASSRSTTQDTQYTEQDDYDHSSEWASYIDEEGHQAWWNWRTQQVTYEPQYCQYYYEDGQLHDTYAEEEEEEDVPMAQPSAQEDMYGPMQRYQALPPIQESAPAA